MATNNFTQIRELLKFDAPNQFYFIQIIKRRKENPGLPTNARVIRDFYIYSLEELDNLEERIISLCETENARAYIRLNRRCAKRIAHEVLKSLANMLATEQYSAIPKIYPKVAGQFHNETDKTWIIDIDDWDPTDTVRAEYYYKLCLAISDLQFPDKEKTVGVTIPTKTGLHLVTRPFNIAKLKLLFPDFNRDDVKKDNPTILYCL